MKKRKPDTLAADVADCLARAGAGLTDDQRTLLAGYLAPVEEKLTQAAVRRRGYCCEDRLPDNRDADCLGCVWHWTDYERPVMVPVRVVRDWGMRPHGLRDRQYWAPTGLRFPDTRTIH